MRRRFSLIRSWPLALLLACFTAVAQTPAPAPVVPQNLEQAAAQRAQSRQMKADADKAYESEQAACYKKFLVNSCLADARKRHTDAVIDARNLDLPAREFQRQDKRKESAAKEAQREADRPQREAEQREQGESYRSDEAAKAAERQAKTAEKEKQAAEGRAKLAAEKAKRDARQAERARKDAERAKKSAEKDAKRAAKAAADAARAAPANSE